MVESSNKQRVQGYIKPESAFFTLAEWEAFVVAMLRLQEQGLDTRGGELGCKDASVCTASGASELAALVN